MTNRTYFALSSAEMYALLAELSGFDMTIRTPEGEKHTVDPMGFNHLPQMMHITCGDDANGCIILRLTRFGVDESGQAKCYPGWCDVSGVLNESTQACLEAINDLLREKSTTSVSSSGVQVLMLPQALEMYQMTRAAIEIPTEKETP